MARHPTGCGHCANVHEYRLARHAQLLTCEATCGGYATEHRDHPQHPPLITFRDWLTGGRRPFEHGYSAYAHGLCKCDLCRAAKAAYMRHHRSTARRPAEAEAA